MERDRELLQLRRRVEAIETLLDRVLRDVPASLLAILNELRETDEAPEDEEERDDE